MEEQMQSSRGVSVEQFLEDLKSVMRDGQDLLRSGVQDAKAKAMDGVRTTEQSVREHPYRSLGAVFGVGVLVGVLVAIAFSGKADEE